MVGGCVAQVKVFLFTDLEGSTRRWETDQTAMSAALHRHDFIVRSALDEHGGDWFKHTGDGVCAAFDSALGAVNAAMAIQDALRGDEMLTPRIGIHLGEAEERGDDWFGPTLNRCARLMSAANGGQTVLSGEVAASVQGRVALRDLGEHLLRDLGHPVHVFQVGDEDFPTLRSLLTTPTNLPAQRSSFIGRDKELERLDTELETARLVTLVGVGGTGKTRLALQAAARVSGRFPDGAFLAELAPVRDPMQVPRTIADAVGAYDNLIDATAADAEKSAGAVVDRLVQWCSSRRVLLVLDNCEHLIGAAAELADRLLAAGSGIVVLATSREPLMISGERIVPVPGLELAAELFGERARAVRPDFELTVENRLVVEELCRRLDDIPLAIELAAARLRALSLEQIAERLDDTFRLLTGGARTARERHQTLAGTLRWSYDLLTPAEQKLFRELGVFVGGATLSAIESVCRNDSAGVSCLDLVQQLVEKSLLVFEEGGSSGRYRMLEIVHQYAVGLLAESPDASEVRGRHLEWAVRMAKPAANILSVNWAYHEVLGPETQNLTQAFTWAIESGNGRAALRLANSTSSYWRNQGLTTRGRAWLTQALEVSDGSEALLRASVSSLLASLRSLSGEYKEMGADYDAALAGFRSIPFPLGEAYCLFGKARALDIVGLYSEAEVVHEQATALFIQEGDRSGEAWHVFNRAWMALARGDLDSAAAMADQLSSDDPGVIGLEPHASGLTLGGLAKMLRGDVAAGRERYVHGLELVTHSLVEHAYGSFTAASVELALDVDSVAGERLLRTSLEEARSAGALEMIEGQLRWSAVVAHRRGEHRRAVELFTAADGVLDKTGINLPFATGASIVAEARAQSELELSESELDEARSVGSSWTLSDAADAALSVLRC